MRGRGSRPSIIRIPGGKPTTTAPARAKHSFEKAGERSAVVGPSDFHPGRITRRPRSFTDRNSVAPEPGQVFECQGQAIGESERHSSAAGNLAVAVAGRNTATEASSGSKHDHATRNQ